MSRKLSKEEAGLLLKVRANADKIRTRTGSEDVRELAKMVKDLTDLFMGV